MDGSFEILNGSNFVESQRGQLVVSLGGDSMVIPDYQTIMLPLLKLLKDGNELTLRECIEKLADHFNLSKEERTQLLPSGQQAVFENRVGWARTYLKKACLLESPRRGVVRVTQRGRDVLSKNLSQIDNKFLMQFEEFKQFRKRGRQNNGKLKKPGRLDSSIDPVEQIEQSFSDYQDALAESLMEEVRASSPAFLSALLFSYSLRWDMGEGWHRQQLS